MIDAMPNVQAPQDRFRLVWIIFFIMGLGALLPWNFFITASAYFRDRLKSVQNESSINGSLVNNGSVAANGTQQAQGTDSVLAKCYDGTMALVSTVAILIASVLTTLVQSTVSARVRILIGLNGNLAMFVLTAVLVWVKMLSPQDFFIITIISVFIINMFGTVFEASLFGLAGQFPTSYTMALMSGIGVSGMFTALAMIFTLLGNKCRTHDITAALGRGPSQNWDALARDGGWRVWVENTTSTVKRAAFSLSCRQQRQQLGGVLVFRDGLHHNRDHHLVLFVALPPGGPHRSTARERNGDFQVDTMCQDNKHILNVRQSVIRKCAIMKQIWMPAFSVCCVFWITFTLFPAITVRVDTVTDDSKWKTFFQPVFGFLAFGFSDFVGRSLTALYMWPKADSWWLPVLVVLRLVFVPLLLLCNIASRPLGITPFRHDAAFVIIMLLMGTSNGYLATLSMSYGPK
ncbi:equilibrative nucleoside transporter 1-like [Lethenteron reissneri]|uniref:equilibrative nucleoside transporter 1-like n=1 Tax=Lethenteron reissneri TaxID=7753 RepID=UPI002AB6AF80|nr:equilibrative nucleoside transporter 1-like [Lethenteron reissneri]